MNIVIARSYLNSLGYEGHSLYLNDPHCRPQISSSQVVFSFPINTCGNIRKVDNSSPSGKHWQYAVLPKLWENYMLVESWMQLFFNIFYFSTVWEWQSCVHQLSPCVRLQLRRDHTPVSLEAERGLPNGTGLSGPYYVPCPSSWQQQHYRHRQIQYQHGFLHIQQLLQ